MAELPIIDDDTPYTAFVPDGCRTGQVWRDPSLYPRGCYATVAALDIPLTPWEQFPDRIADMTRDNSRLSDVWFGAGVEHLDQDGFGYCWAHSATHAVMALRAVQNQPTVPLSAFAVAATIKGGRDEGGWGALALDFITTRGVPTTTFWPQGSADLSHGSEACWADAAKHKVAEGWVDLAMPVYDRDLSWQQVLTLLCARVPVIADYNWWGHSVLAIDPVDAYPTRAATDPSRYGVVIMNSWKDWGDRGMGVLKDSRARPSNATAPRTTTPA